MNRSVLAACLALAVALAVAFVLRPAGGGGRASDAAPRRSAPAERLASGPAAISGADAPAPETRPGRRAATLGAGAAPTGLLAVALRSTNDGPDAAAVEVSIDGEGSDRSLYLRPPGRAVVRLAPGAYRVAAVEDARPRSSRRWSLLAERSRAVARVREGETTEVTLLVETPGSITVRAPERAAVSLGGLTLHRVDGTGATDPGRTAPDSRTVAWRWLGPGTYEVRGDPLRAPLVVTLAAGEHHEAALDLDLVRVVLRPEIRASGGGPSLAVPCLVTVSADETGRDDRVTVARQRVSETVGAGEALELDLPPGTYTARVRAGVAGEGVLSDLRDGGSELVLVQGDPGRDRAFGSGGAFVTQAPTLHGFVVEPSADRIEVPVPHTVEASEGVASIDLRVEGGGELWLHYPQAADVRRAPRSLTPKDGRVDLALDVERLRGGAVEVTTSRSPGEGEVLLREVAAPGRTTWRVVSPGAPRLEPVEPFLVPR